MVNVKKKSKAEAEMSSFNVIV
ncbi:uncharacterized protein G2W53_008205 [Senna tora]|uniref:Uncharacterized protein n=1 Tax=Senna tora TaxID=362788 RepID=A0A834X6L8_9FABA|nr:uncharacterized protein G2W53_008205 [Senna tora]